MRERSEENMKETTLQVREEGGGGGVPGTRTEILLQPMVKTIENVAVALQPMDNHIRADICTAASGGFHSGTGGDELNKAVAHEKPMMDLAGHTSHKEEPTEEQVFRQELQPVGK